MFYYIGTVILNMSPREFWRCTPRKLAALASVHTRLNDPKKGNQKKVSSRGPVGAPDTFIDQLNLPK